MPCRRLPELALLALVALAGCAHVETRVLRLGPRLAPRPAQAPVVLMRPPLPPAALPAREVALIEVTSYSSEWASGIAEALQRAAREVGADVVLWMREDRAESFTRVIGSAVRTRAARVTPTAP